MCIEVSIEFFKSKKTLNIMKKRWGNPIHNGLDLERIHVNAISRYNISKEFHFSLMEFTFFQLIVKSNFLNCTKQVENVVHVPPCSWKKWGCH
jgi:hypothetical protein